LGAHPCDDQIVNNVDGLNLAVLLVCSVPVSMIAVTAIQHAHLAVKDRAQRERLNRRVPRDHAAQGAYMRPFFG
jgi:hypothetical protein